MEQRPKLAITSAVFLGFSVVFSAFPSYSSGSMAPESRIIIVRPSKEIRRQSEIRQREKARRAAEKAEAKADAAAEKARIKKNAAYEKARLKRLADQRKKLK